MGKALDCGELIPWSKSLEGECAGLLSLRWAGLGQRPGHPGAPLPSSLLSHVGLSFFPDSLLQAEWRLPERSLQVLTAAPVTGTLFGN